MRKQILFLILPFLFPTPALHAGGKPDDTPPAVLIQIRSLERVLDHGKEVLSLTGNKDLSGKLDALLRAKIGAGGLEGVDPKRPLGLMVRFGKDISDIAPLLLLPIAKEGEKAFLKVLELNKLKVTKNKNDIYTIRLGRDIEVELFFRFAKGYLHGTILNASVLEDERLEDPVKLLGGPEGPAFSTTIYLDQIPKAARGLALVKFEEFYTPLLEGMKGESKIEVEFRRTALKTVGQAVKDLLQEGQKLQFTLDLDSKGKKLILSTSLTGLKGTGLAKTLQMLGEQQSRFAGLESDKALLNAVMNIPLPEELKTAFLNLFDQIKTKAGAELKDEEKRKQAEALLTLLHPTFKEGRVDAFFLIDGEKEKDLDYLIALGVKNGKEVEKKLLEMVEKALELMKKDKDKFKLPKEKVGDVSIYLLPIPGGEALAPFLSEPTAYFAFREDAVFIALGKGGLETIKQALSKSKPGKMPLVLYRADMRRVLTLLAKDGKIPDPKMLLPAGGDNTLLFRIESTMIEKEWALTGRVELPLAVFRMTGMEVKGK